MNQDQRKYLKQRVYDLHFDRYHQDEDDTAVIRALRSEVKEKEKRISDFEAKCIANRRKSEGTLIKVKNKALELIYGDDYALALVAVKDVENKFEEARAKKYGSPAN